MYLPQDFAETRPETLFALIRAHSLGLLISASEHDLIADPIPFLLDTKGDVPILKAHVARANPQWKHLQSGAKTLVVFQGPETYITPSFYASKAEHGKVVPTWNYAMVQARGLVTIHDDAAWVHSQATALTDAQEASRRQPWHVTDAPERYINVQMRGIVGIEIAVDQLIGKWKMSQNRNDADRKGVESGLSAEGRTGISAMVKNAHD